MKFNLKNICEKYSINNNPKNPTKDVFNKYLIDNLPVAASRIGNSFNDVEPSSKFTNTNKYLKIRP